MKLLQSFKAGSLLLALIFSTLFVGAQVSAAPVVDFGNITNLPISEVTILDVSATGLTPNVDVILTQCTGGDPDIDGQVCVVAGCPQPQSGCLEQIFRTDGSGNFSAQVPVSYDAGAYYANYGDLFAVCDVSTNPLRYCTLNLFYLQDSDVAIAQTNLYFGNGVTTPTGPFTKDDCKDKKWDVYTHLGFKNQGACVSYVTRGI